MISMDKHIDKKSKHKVNVDMQKVIIGVVLLLIIFAAGARFGAYLHHNEQAVTAGEDAVAGEVTVDIKGAVGNPGLYQLPAGSRVEDALAAAGMLADAEPQLLNLAAILVDGSELIVPYQQGEIDWNALASSRGGVYYGVETAAAATESSGSDTMIGIININTATVEELQHLSGIGEVKAQRIIEHREQNGPFVTIEQIMNVSGIGNATFEKIREHICVE